MVDLKKTRVEYNMRMELTEFTACVLVVVWRYCLDMCTIRYAHSYSSLWLIQW